MRYNHAMSETVKLSTLIPDTLIAAEKTGRTAYLMELDPIYCDVIVTRWEQATGKKAVLSAG
jgi:DNA modification methylase